MSQKFGDLDLISIPPKAEFSVPPFYAQKPDLDQDNDAEAKHSSNELQSLLICTPFIPT